MASISTRSILARGRPALLFLHYWGGSIRSWLPVMETLSDANRRVAIDFRGWGQSSKDAMDHGLETLADDVIGVISELGLTEFVIIGHSMGGKVAQIVAARRPKGLQSLILVAPAPPTALDAPEEQRQGMIAAYESREGVMGIIADLPLSDAQREQVIEDALSGSPAAKRAWPEQGMTKDIREQASGITVPVHVIVGSADPVEPEASLREAFGKVIPGAAFTVLAGVGHLAPIEASGKVGAAIRAALVD